MVLVPGHPVGEIGIVFLKGSWEQTHINLDTEAPVTGAPMAVVYAAGVVFAVSAALLLARELWRTLSGQLSESELVMVQESEDVAHIHDEEAALAAVEAHAQANKQAGQQAGGASGGKQP